MSVKPSISFRNISTYIVEPVGEPVITQPANYSIDFSPQSSCMEEAPEIDPIYTSEKPTLALKTDLTKESLTGLKLVDSPEFTDAQITELEEEITYTSSVWTYLLGLFTTVPKSVKQHIVKVWIVLENLATRVGLLEDDYILKYVVPVDTAAIDLTTDKYGNPLNFSNDSGFDIIIEVKQWVDGGLNRLYLRFNGINSNIYFTGTYSVLGYIYTQGTNYASQYSVIRCEIHSNEVFGNVIGHSTTNVFYPFHTEGFNSSSINSITLSKSSTPDIPAGAVILIKKR